MSEDEDFHDPDDNAEQFPLYHDDLGKIAGVIKLIRGQLGRMKPKNLRAAASILLALERLPRPTPGIKMTFGFLQPNVNGTFRWADIWMSEGEFRLDVGVHFYDPEFCGDTEARTVFEAFAGGDWPEGDIEDWIQTAEMFASESNVTLDDDSNYDVIEWSTDGNQGVLCPEQSDKPTEPSLKAAFADQDIASHDELWRIFDEASRAVAKEVREPLSYQQIIALAEVFAGWATDGRITPEQSARLNGWGQSLIALAVKVGPDWHPPIPDALSLVGFLGRQIVESRLSAYE